MDILVPFIEMQNLENIIDMKQWKLESLSLIFVCARFYLPNSQKNLNPGSHPDKPQRGRREAGAEYGRQRGSCQGEAGAAGPAAAEHQAALVLRRKTAR